MSNKLKEHIRNEFIEAAKKLVFEEGIGAVTARRVGKETGYSYATVYSYFEKLDSLVWHVGLSLNEDMAELYYAYEKSDDFTIEDIKTLFIDYIQFHFEKPNIFKLFLDQKIDIPPEEILKQMVSPNVNRIVYKVVGDVVKRRGAKESEVIMVSDMLMSSVYGYLAMYYGSIPVITQEEIIKRVKAQINYLCK